MKDLAEIEEIYHKALQLSLAEREIFLCDACGDDLELRCEVESLLLFDESANRFFELPPDDLAADFFKNSGEENLIGKELNHYRILSLLGAGGMGEVYLAEDVNLGRKAAIKVLPLQFSQDAERRQRFEKEARAVSALNHPNIITIYGIEKANNLTFITTELVDGRTLRERIAEKQISWEETIEIGIQIASALESAHSVGIIHRDIKPANIMIRQDGLVKVLDFGLAKLIGGEESEESRVRSKESDVSTSKLSNDSLLLTQTNAVMGTLNYMSPEQALGEKVDARSDIFSLGVVLYEMLSGIQPFRGESKTAVYQATIFNNPLPLNQLNSEIPFELNRIIGKAMEKDGANRYQNVGDLRSDLLQFKENSNKAEIPATNISRTKMFFPITGGIAAILVSLGTYYFFYKPLANKQGVEGIKFKYTQLTSQSGEELFPNLSPDGKNVIYSGRASGYLDIYLQPVNGSNVANLTKDSKVDNKQAVFSPDGKQIAFRSERMGGGIFVMDVNGENVRRISDTGFYPNWSPDGKEIIFGMDDFDEPGNRTIVPSQLWKIKVETGEKILITEQDAVQPSWSPNGKRIAFWGINSGGQRDVWTISVDGGEPVAVTNDSFIDWNPVWSNDGKFLYFVSNRSGSMNLWRVAIDENSGKVSGNSEPMTIPSNYSQLFNFARDGKGFVYVQTVNYSNIFKIDFDAEKETVGKTSFEITKGSKITTNPEISADNQFITFDAIGDKQEDIFVANADGSNIRQLTNDVYKDRTPRWSPDGKRLAFFTDETGKYEGYVMNADGGSRKQVTKFPADSWAQIPVWSPDGKRLIFNSRNAYPIIFDSDKVAADQTPQYLPDEGNPKRWFMAFSWSPDGKKLIGYGRDSEKPEPYLMTFDFIAGKYETVSDFGTRAFWLTDNKRAVFYHNDKIYLLNTETKRRKELLSVAPNLIQSITISKDNRAIYYTVQKSESDIWLANSQ